MKLTDDRSSIGERIARCAAQADAGNASMPEGARLPKITFAIAAFNAAPFIAEAIASILSQTLDSFEVIVVDDASTDSTAKIVSKLAAKNPRIHLIENGRRSGPAAARNKALARARGEWFAVVDADDWIAPARSARLLEIAQLAGADIVADNFLRCSHAKKEELGHGLICGPSPYFFMIDASAYLRGNIMFSSEPALGYLKPMFRVDFLRRNGLTYSERLQVGEDFDFCLRALVAGARYIATSEPHYRYRVREGSLSWRISVPQLEELLRAHRELMARRHGLSPEFGRAGKRYEIALERAVAYMSLVESLKSRNWKSAALALFARMDLLPLLAWSLRQFAAKRIRANFSMTRT